MCKLSQPHKECHYMHHFNLIGFCKTCLQWLVEGLQDDCYTCKRKELINTLH